MQDDFLRNTLPFPEIKDYGRMLENIDAGVKSLEPILREMIEAMKEQNAAIETIFKSNQELHERLKSFAPVNN